MGDAKLYTRVKASDILTELKNYEKKPRSGVYQKTILKKIIVNLSIGDNEVIILASDVVRILFNMGYEDLEVKNMCYLYLITYWKHCPKEAISALPFMLEDYKRNSDTSVIDACAALKTIASIQLKAYIDALIPLLEDAFNDSNASIRRTAAYCVAMIFKSNEVENPGSSPKLLQMLNDALVDDDLDVVAAALNSLGDITLNTDKLKLSTDKEHALKLTEGMASCQEWCQVSILNALLTFVPQDHKIAADLIDLILPYLQSDNSSIALNALKVIVYFSYYINNVLDVFPSLPQSISAAISNLMLRPPEVQFLAMRNVILLLLDKPALLDLDIRMFFCQYDDLLYIKDTKLEIIFLLANEGNMDLVLTELQEYAMEIDIQMVRKSIRAIGNLAVKIEPTSEKCVSVLADLLSESIPYVIEEIAIITRDILRKYPGTFDYLIDMLVDRVSLIKESDAKTSIIWILGEYSSSISKSVTLLKQFSETFVEELTETQLTLLTAIMKAHTCQPYNKELHALVEDILEVTIVDIDNPDLRERGLFYWRLLSSGLPNIIDIIKPRLPTLKNDQAALPNHVREELDLCMGSIASIYLRPVKQVFRHCKPRTLSDSPALVRQDLSNSRLSNPLYNDRRSTLYRSRSSTLSSNSGSFRSRMAFTSQRVNDLTINENNQPSPAENNSESHGLSGIMRKLSLKK